eukprot:11374626-Alexandrium_andersonii.AAC.1
MSASLVGSEMCIRDSACLVSIASVLQAWCRAVHAHAHDSLSAASGAASIMAKVHLQAHACFAASLRGWMR